MLGIHQQFSKPMANIAGYAGALGADTLQIYIRNNRNMKRRYISQEEVTAFNLAIHANGIKSVVVHAPLCMNLATSDLNSRKRYATSMCEDLYFTNLIECDTYYVVHPGSATDTDRITARDNIHDALKLCADSVGNTTICLEFMAGSGSQMLCNVQEVRGVLAQCWDIPNVRLCFDTCHAFASGYDICELAETLQHCVKVVHLNGSMKACGYRVDRHASIRKSFIPTEQLLYVANFYKDMPIILETPGDVLVDDFIYVKENLKL